jgi:signal transduction histidine kinase
VIGTLNMFFRHPHAVEKEQIDRLTAFANQASIAIQNASLYKELETSLAQEHALRTRLIQSEKFAAMGRLLASVAHELNNPLQTIKNCLFLTRQDSEPDSPVQEYLDMAFSETARLSKLVGQLRELYRPRAENITKPYVFAEIVEEVHNLLKPHLAQQKVTWVQKAGFEDAKIRCNLDQIKQVLINISMNGIEAMQPNGGTLEVGLSLSGETDMVAVYFHDSGPGIAPEVLKNLFEPFVTTKSSGLGLGLSICYELIQRHHGQITVDTQLDQGTTFTVWLPLLQENQNS